MSGNVKGRTSAAGEVALEVAEQILVAGEALRGALEYLASIERASDIWRRRAHAWRSRALRAEERAEEEAARAQRAEERAQLAEERARRAANRGAPSASGA